VSSSEFDDHVKVYSVGKNVGDFNAPVSSRFQVEPKDLVPGFGTNKSVVCAYPWDVQQNQLKGYDREAPQAQVLTALEGAGYDQIIFRACMSKEHMFKISKEIPGQPQYPVKSNILNILVSNFKRVSFAPCARVHNGFFWIIASDKQEGGVPGKALESMAVYNWRVFSLHYAFFMMRASILKNVSSYYYHVAPRCPTDALDLLYPPEVGSFNFTTHAHALGSWWFVAKRKATVKYAMTVEAEEGETAIEFTDFMDPEMYEASLATRPLQLVDGGVDVVPAEAPDPAEYGDT